MPKYTEPKPRPESLISRRLKEIARITTGQELTSFEITEALGCNHQTALRYIGRLVERGCLQNTNGKHWNGRFRWVKGMAVPVTVKPPNVKPKTAPVIRRDPLVALLFSDRP